MSGEGPFPEDAGVSSDSSVPGDYPDDEDADELEEEVETDVDVDEKHESG